MGGGVLRGGVYGKPRILRIYLQQSIRDCTFLCTLSVGVHHVNDMKQRTSHLAYLKKWLRVFYDIPPAGLQPEAPPAPGRIALPPAPSMGGPCIT